MRSSALRSAPVLLAAVLACASLPALAVAANVARTPHGETTTVAVHEASGDTAQMGITWFVPAGPGPFPVVLFRMAGRPARMRAPR